MKKHLFWLAIVALGLVMVAQAAARAEEPPAREDSAKTAETTAAADKIAKDLLASPPDGLDKGDVAMAFGWIYLNGILGAPDYPKARDYYQMALDAGKFEAGTMLGAMTLNADVFEMGSPDVTKALTIYEEAARAGSADANYVLGVLHYDGSHGMVMDPTKGGKYLVQAARLGSEDAIDRLKPRLGQAGFPAAMDDLVDEDQAEETAAREEHFVESANQVIEILEARLAEAGVHVGQLHFEGYDPVLADLTPEEQKAYWEKVDKAVDDTCRKIVDRQPDEKTKGDAALIVGVLHHLGLLHGHTPAKTKEYMEYALERNVPEAKVALGEYYLNILGDDDEADKAVRDVAKGLELLEEAAKTDSVDALRLLGVLYADGVEGVEPDAGKSEHYLLAAAKHGDPQALEMLEPVFEKARDWEEANPGQKSPTPSGPEAVVDPDLAKKATERRNELETLGKAINEEIEKSTRDAMESLRGDKK